MKTERMKYLLFLFPALFLWMVIQYAWDSYSPVPFWDSWDGLMSAVKWVQEGEVWEMFSAHNGHRITLTRLLFLADYYWLGSHFSVLFALNVVLMLVTFGLFAWLSRRYLGRFDIFYICLAGCLVLLLSQAENIRWEFQSQFFLAQIVPLAAFLTLANAMDNDTKIKNWKNFCIAMLLAVAANFTMGNGFAASMIMLVAVILSRSSMAATSAAIIVAACSLVLLLTGKGPANSMSQALGTLDLVACVKYVLVYLGSPAFHVVRFYGAGRILAASAAVMSSLLFIGLLVFYGWSLLKKRSLGNRYALAAWCIAAYVMITACLTAIARHQYTVTQAVSERYTTPVLMGWAAMLLLFWPMLNKWAGKWLKITSIVCMAALLPYQQLVAQKKVNGFYEQVPFTGDLLMLSLLLGVDDPENMQRLHPLPEHVRKVVGERTEDSGFFTHSRRYVELQRRLGETYDIGRPPPEQCRLHMDGIRNLEGGYQSAYGWFKYGGYNQERHLFVIYNELYEKVGYGITGQPRPDVSQHFSDREVNVGFGSYVLEEALQPGAVLHAYIPDTGYYCSHAVRALEE